MSNIPPVWWSRCVGGTSAASGKRLSVLSASKGYHEWQPLNEGSGEEAIPIDGEDFWTTKFLQTVPSAPPAKRWWPAEGEEDQRHGLAEKLPDLNTIENLWAIMKASLKRAPNITSLPLLGRSIQFMWVKSPHLPDEEDCPPHAQEIPDVPCKPGQDVQVPVRSFSLLPKCNTKLFPVKHVPWKRCVKVVFFIFVFLNILTLEWNNFCFMYYNK